jgi:putative ABC transport system permease protein
MGSIDLSFQDLLWVYLLLLIPVGVSLYLKLGIVKETLIALVRMTLQLILVGLYLDVIFEINSLLLNIAWILVMLVTANVSIIKRSNLKLRKIFPATFIGISFATALVLVVFVGLAIQPTPVYNARYLIPIGGMILGNCMRGNIISLERFYSSIRKNEKEFITYQLLGANLSEACLPYMRSALLAAIGPHISTMATMGIVSLPGMMTGQILGGATPSAAIKYQIAIMICIFTAMITASTVNILLTWKIAFNDYGMLKQDFFAKPK